MQLFPAISATSNAISGTPDAGSGVAINAGNGFDAVLSSFIEEGRYDYSGRPPGFSAYGVTNGTIDGETASELARQLRKRDVADETINRLETLAASGSPLTIGTAFQTMGGHSRLSETLDGDTRDEFKTFLAKIGCSKDEIEEMLGLSDAGDMSAMWKKLGAKLSGMDGEADVTLKEWNALLKGLDLSDSTRKQLLGLFKGESNSLTGSQMEALLANVSKEVAAREKAALHARTQMRSAMEEALRNAKSNEQGATVDSNRGSRLTEQKEEFMQDSVRKNTGSDHIKQDKEGEEEGFENPRDGKSRSERILALESETRSAKGKAGEAANESPAHKLFQKIDSLISAPQQPVDPNQAQNLNSMARNFRQEIFSQVEQGLLQTAQNGSGRLTLQLNPGELGQVTVILSVVQGEVKATIRAENQDSASVLREQMAEMKAALEAQGLKVKELDVQTGLQDNGFAYQWEGHNKHNLMRDADARDRMLRLARIRREAGGAATGSGTSSAAPQATSTSGLHIVA